MRNTLGALACLVALTGAASAECRRGEPFGEWLGRVRADAAAAGVSQKTLAALDGLKPNPKILGSDRAQTTLSQSFLDYAGRLASDARLKRGREMLKKHARALARVERAYGVPAPVVVAFWGLESDYGGYMGEADVLRALATLGHDCRRGDAFRDELIAALRIIDRGDLSRADMVGSWAGAIGQTQFVPTTYLEHAVDGDGDGRRDLVNSVPDVLASTAAYVRAEGWRPGEPWITEVRVPEGFPYHEAGRTIRHPRRFFAGQGVRQADGSPLPADDLDSGLQLPMGRFGPAFLLYPNFEVFWEYNNSSNYALSAAYLASRLAGAPALRRGDPPPILSATEMKEIQERLNALGLDAGKPDGRLGEATRTAVRAAQSRFGLPADGYPDKALLKRLRQAG